jgi:signal transduction histidine kinase
MTRDDDVLEPPPDVRRQLEMANSQLALYARDLKRIVDAERRKSIELAQANARLKILDHLKMEFLSFISHELRTPLNTMAAVDLVNLHGDPKEQAEILDMIRRGYERLYDFVQRGIDYFQWLAIERIDTQETTDLARAVRRAPERLPALVEPGVDFRLQLPQVPCTVPGARADIERVVDVILSNALKFSPEAKRIAATLHQHGPLFKLTVTDAGRGFPPDWADEIFRPFTVADVLHHRRGTGLSLATAQAIVRAHGGTIRAKSGGAGAGATFEVEIPAAFHPLAAG